MPPASPQQISRFRLALAVLVLTGMVSACGNGGDEMNGGDVRKIAAPASYREGDSFPASRLPATISEWLFYYGSLDTGIQIHRFQNSGVPLHIGPLEPASNGIAKPGHALAPLLAFSPDSSRAIDFTSYGSIADTSESGEITLLGGEADQEITLLLAKEGRRLQLMFNGPQSSLEAAGWITNDACLVGLIQIDASRQRFYPELMLFNFRDSLFTNFRTPGDFPVDLLRQQPGGYLEKRIKQVKRLQP